MEIKLASQNDKERIKNIWRYCFDDKEIFVDWFFKDKYCPDNTLVAYEGEVPMSNLQLIPYRISFKGEELNASYMVGVATMPEARGKGYVEELIVESLKVMRKRKELISILIPFRYDFYRRYGWEVCYNHNSYRVEPSMLKPLIKKYGKTRPIDFRSMNDIEALKKIYHGFVFGKNGYIIRSNNDWENILEDMLIYERKGYFLQGDNGEEGYILFGISEKHLNIHEMAYVNSDAYRAILGFVYMHSAQANTVIWKAPSDDKTYAFLSEPRQIATICPFAMARVVDVAEVLRLLIKFVDSDFRLTVCVKDKLAKWNNGVFEIKNGEISTTDINLRDKSKLCNTNDWSQGIICDKLLGDKPDISCDINTFTQLAMGYITVLDAYKIGLVDVKDSSSIDRTNIIFKLENNYINDYY